MKKIIPLLIFTLISTIGFAQCTINDATDCQCLDNSQVDCDLLPDIQLSWYGLDDVSDGPTEYPQTGAGNNNGRLRISVSTPNTGRGPLTVRGAGPEGNRWFICGTDTLNIYDPNSEESFYCPNGEEAKQIIWQRVYHKNSDNSMSFNDYMSGTMTYHPTHGHNHTDDWGVFTLRIEDEDEPDPRNWPIVSDGAKMGFCLMDYGICSPDPSIDTYTNTDYTGHCKDDNTVFQEGETIENSDVPNWGLGGGAYDCSEIEQGISVGYLDMYGEWLDDQWINLDPNICNGDYWIVGIIDPNNFYLESNKDNNYTAIPVTLSLQNDESTSTINLIGEVDICEGESIELAANYGDAYLWSTGDTSQTIIVSEPGAYSVTVHNTNCSTSFISEETIINELSIPAPNLINAIDTACLGDELLLELDAEDVYWYNEDGVLVSTQNPYIMPLLEENIHLFASQIQSQMYSEHVGEIEHQGTNDYSGSTYNAYQIFNASADFTLQSVEVFTEYPGERLIELKSELGILVYDTLVMISEDMTILLNWEVEAGNDYKLGTNTELNNLNFDGNNPMLKRSNQETNYPYSIQNIIEITDSEWGQDYYYYFYNWEISWMGNSCESAEKLEVFVEALECNQDLEEILLSENTPVQFFDLLGRQWNCSYKELPLGCYIAKQDNKSLKIFKN